MSTTTDKLALFKYDPSTDGAQTFNIKKALNDNWDKLDDAVKEILITLANKAPPAGLGWVAVLDRPCLDANEATLGGFDYWGPECKKHTISLWSDGSYPKVLPIQLNHAVTQIASEELGGTSPQASIAVRKSTDNSDGSWGPWEWINPPMELGSRISHHGAVSGRARLCKSCKLRSFAQWSYVDGKA